MRNMQTVLSNSCKSGLAQNRLNCDLNRYDSGNDFSNALSKERRNLCACDSLSLSLFLLLWSVNAGIFFRAAAIPDTFWCELLGIWHRRNEIRSAEDISREKQLLKCSSLLTQIPSEQFLRWQEKHCLHFLPFTLLQILRQWKQQVSQRLRHWKAGTLRCRIQRQCVWRLLRSWCLSGFVAQAVKCGKMSWVMCREGVQITRLLVVSWCNFCMDKPLTHACKGTQGSEGSLRIWCKHQKLVRHRGRQWWWGWRTSLKH